MPGPSAAADPKGGGQAAAQQPGQRQLDCVGQEEGNTHQPNTVNIPTGPEELVYTA